MTRLSNHRKTILRGKFIERDDLACALSIFSNTALINVRPTYYKRKETETLSITTSIEKNVARLL